MRLYGLLFAGAVLAPGSLLAQEPPQPAGRYQIAPDEDGFVRLDTETGAMSHCAKHEGSWRCDILAEDNAAAAARIESLSGQVEALGKKVDELNRKIEALAVVPPKDGTSGAEPNDPEFDRALGFAERLMQRFFDMVRQLKNEESGKSI